MTFEVSHLGTVSFSSLHHPFQPFLHFSQLCPIRLNLASVTNTPVPLDTCQGSPGGHSLWRTHTCSKLNTHCQTMACLTKLASPGSSATGCFFWPCPFLSLPRSTYTELRHLSTIFTPAHTWTCTFETQTLQAKRDLLSLLVQHPTQHGLNLGPSYIKKTSNKTTTTVPTTPPTTTDLSSGNSELQRS